MSDTATSGSGSDSGQGSDGREGDSRSGESWIDRLMTAVGLKPSTAALREHLQSLLDGDGDGDGTFTAEERAMIRNILRLRETRVEDVMVQRSEIAAVTADLSLADLLLAFRESGHSRMPVYVETLDDASGMVHIRDVMTHVTDQALVAVVEGAEAGDLRLDRVDLTLRLADAGLVRPVLFVPPSMPATDLLARMQANRIQIALVIDEFGGVDGLVSLEDIVEIVVGEIEDEHDTDEEGAAVVPAGEGVWVVDGLAELAEVEAATGIDFPLDAAEDIETLGGLVFALIGRLPVVGETVSSDQLPGITFEILAADPRRIRKVRLARRSSATGTGLREVGAA